MSWKNIFHNPHLFKIHNTRANGNCFFEALSIALDKPILVLRQIVAYSLTKPTHQNNQIIDTWRELDHAGLECARHVKCVRNIPLKQSLTRVDKQKIVNSMLTTDYWGDEYAIRTIQNVFNIGICIVDMDSGVLRKPMSSESPTNEGDPAGIVMLLYTNNNHYNLIVYDNRALFRTDDFLEMLRPLAFED